MSIGSTKKKIIRYIYIYDFLVNIIMKTKRGLKVCSSWGKRRSLVLLLVVGVFLFGIVGGVSGVDIRVTDNNAYTWITSNTNITVNTYNQTWLEFDGDTNKLQFNSYSYLSGLKNLSTSLWIYSKGTQNANTFVFRTGQLGGVDAIGLDVNLSGTGIRCHIGEEDGGQHATGTVKINLNQWYHVVCWYNSSGFILYLDGKIKNEILFVPNQTVLEGGFLYIGSEGVNPRTFNGSIDEVRFYNETLTTSKINVLRPWSCSHLKQ